MRRLLKTAIKATPTSANTASQIEAIPIMPKVRKINRTIIIKTHYKTRKKPFCSEFLRILSPELTTKLEIRPPVVSFKSPISKYSTKPTKLVDFRNSSEIYQTDLKIPALILSNGAFHSKFEIKWRGFQIHHGFLANPLVCRPL